MEQSEKRFADLGNYQMIEQIKNGYHKKAIIATVQIGNIERPDAVLHVPYESRIRGFEDLFSGLFLMLDIAPPACRTKLNYLQDQSNGYHQVN